MTGAIRFHKTGPPDVLRWEQVDVNAPAAGEVRLRQTAIGINMKEIGERNGAYPCPPLPTIPGIEAAAVVTEVGRGVVGLAPGDRVCYATMPTGSYCQERTLAAERVVKCPSDIDDELIAATLHKGMTARNLVLKTYPIKAGDTVLVHAAAGGTGSIVSQWAKHLGATVIGTVGSEAKVRIARNYGCDHVINYCEEDFAERVKDITDGEGCPVVYDSVGKDTFNKSLESLHPLGMMVLYGIASGHPPPLELMKFDIWKSYFYTRPSFFVYTRSREDLLASANDLFAVLRSGAVRIDIHARFPLREAAEAHRIVETRGTTGSVILIP